MAGYIVNVYKFSGTHFIFKVVVYIIQIFLINMNTYLRKSLNKIGHSSRSSSIRKSKKIVDLLSMFDNLQKK